MLSFLHSGLLAANQTQRDSSSVDPIKSAFARGADLRKAGKLAEALLEFQRALTLSRQSNNTEDTISSLMLMASVYLLSYQYQSAMAAAKEAVDMARKAGNYQLAGGASGTIASIYMVLGDSRTAEVEGHRAIDLLKLAPPNEPRTRKFLIRAFHLEAALCSMQGKATESASFFDQAISLAQQMADKPFEADLWDDRGVALLRNKQLALAEQSLNHGFTLRQTLHDENSLAVSKEHLAELELKRPSPNYSVALRLVDEAFAANSTAFKSAPQYYPIHIRAQILLRSGEKQKALAEFRRAVQAAETWRQGALPGDTTNTQTVVLLHEVYRDFAHLAAQISLETNNSTLRNEALEVIAANRAASLREQLRLALASDSKLPDSYYEKLSALQSAQAHVTLGRNTKSDQAELVRLRTEISEFENKFAVQIGKNYFSSEKNLRRNSLRDIQSRLGQAQLLLSFSLGEAKSYLWAITGDQVNLFQLDGREQIEYKAAQLTKVVRTGTGTNDAAFAFSHALFGSLPERLNKKPEWLIVADGSLLSGVPFAALPSPERLDC